MRRGRARAAQRARAARARLAAGAPRGRSRRRPRRHRPASPAAPAPPAPPPWPRAPPRQGLDLGYPIPPRADSLSFGACVSGKRGQPRAQQVKSAAGAVHAHRPPCASTNEPALPPARATAPGGNRSALAPRQSAPLQCWAVLGACGEVLDQASPTNQGHPSPCRAGARAGSGAARRCGRAASRAPRAARAVPPAGSCALHGWGLCPAPAAARALASALGFGRSPGQPAGPLSRPAALHGSGWCPAPDASPAAGVAWAPWQR